MAVTPTGSDGSMPVSNAALTELEAAINSSKLDINIKTSDVSMGGATEKTTLALSTTLDELYKIALTGTGQASSPSINLIQKRGTLNNAASTNTWIDILADGVTTSSVSVMTAAATVKVSSSSANDTSAGTGARTVKLWGLNSSYVEQSETITLNGVTAVTSVNTYIAINHIEVLTVGSGGVNAGTINVLNNAADTWLSCAITAGANQGQGSAFTVPAGKTAILHVANASATLDSIASTVTFSAVRFKTSHPTAGIKVYNHCGVPSHSLSDLVPPIVTIPEKTTIWLQGKSGAASVLTTVQLKYILVGSILTATNYWL